MDSGIDVKDDTDIPSLKSDIINSTTDDRNV